MYKVFSVGLQKSESDDDALEDPWRTVFDDIRDWIASPSSIMIFVFAFCALFSYSTYVAMQQITRSTYMCFAPLDSRSATFSMQLISLGLDAAIIILLWKILVWTRSDKQRIRLVSQVLCFAALSTMALSLVTAVLGGARTIQVGFESLYTFDIVVDSFAFAILSTSAALWISDSAPVDPACTTTFLAGIVKASENVFLFGDWLHFAKWPALLPLSGVIFGAIFFNKLHGVKTVAGAPRILFNLLALLLLITAHIFIFVKHVPRFENTHPVSDLIYHAGTEHDRWIVKASMSTTLHTAADIYSEKHGGRLPPPGFDAWYETAKGSQVIDEFPQIDRDLHPFWAVQPAELLKRVDAIASYPGITTISITDGAVSWDEEIKDESRKRDVESLTAKLKKFSKHLPNMKIPINFGPSPRILPSWQVRTRSGTADLSAITDMISARGIEAQNVTVEENLVSREKSAATLSWDATTASTFRAMQKAACPSHSMIRSHPYWDIGEFCWKCARGHSEGPFVGSSSRDQVLDTCSQPDLRYLHGFYLSNPAAPPITQLLPLFSFAKTEEFADILIPLPRQQGEPDNDKKFEERSNQLYWRGSVGEHKITDEAVRGSHKYRLLHSANAAEKVDKTTMVLRAVDQVKDDKKDTKIFVFERFGTQDASELSHLDIGIGDYAACMGDNCDLIQRTYSTRNGNMAQALFSRYVLLLDEDDGPPLHFMQTLKSRSLPFLSTVFRTWYSERLQPWLHYIPIDPRYQGLHSTLAFFAGTTRKQNINGKPRAIDGKVTDGEYLANQGKRWADVALREEDEVIYLFRLLLEWGRLINENRDTIGYGGK